MNKELNKENQEWFDSKISNALVVFAPCDVRRKLLSQQTEIEQLKEQLKQVKLDVIDDAHRYVVSRFPNGFLTSMTEFRSKIKGAPNE